MFDQYNFENKNLMKFKEPLLRIYVFLLLGLPVKIVKLYKLIFLTYFLSTRR